MASTAIELAISFTAMATASQVRADKAFTGPAELSELILASKDLEACLGKRVVQYALGRPDVPEDKATLDAFAEVFSKKGERLDQILIEIVASPSFALKKVE